LGPMYPIISPAFTSKFIFWSTGLVNVFDKLCVVITEFTDSIKSLLVADITMILLWPIKSASGLSQPFMKPNSREFFQHILEVILLQGAGSPLYFNESRYYKSGRDFDRVR